MKTKCFVRTLNEVVDNASLPILNTMRISLQPVSYSSGSQTNYVYQFTMGGIFHYEVQGDGYFTNSDGTQNLGTTWTSEGTFYVKTLSQAILVIYDMINACGDFTSYLAHTKPSFNIAELFQNDTDYDDVQIGLKEAATASISQCYGNVDNVDFKARGLYIGGVTKLSGNIGEVIKNQASRDRLNNISFSYTSLKFDLSCLEGKHYVYVVAGRGTTGDIKWLGHTRNRTFTVQTTRTKYLTGSLNELAATAVACGHRKPDTDYFFLPIGSSGIPTRYTKVTFTADGVTKTLHEYYTDYINDHAGVTSTVYILIRWDRQGNVTSYELTTNVSSLRNYVAIENVIDPPVDDWDEYYNNLGG